jgi:hypothetical protein
MDETKQMYHTKFKESLHTSNTYIFHYLHSYTWHTNEPITSSHRSAGKSPNTRCKVPTNQESNSLAPRNRILKLKNHQFLPIYRWFMDKNRLPSSPPTRRRAPTDLSAELVDSQSNVIGFQPVAADFLPLRPASPPLSTGQNGGKLRPLFCRAGETE